MNPVISVLWWQNIYICKSVKVIAKFENKTTGGKVGVGGGEVMGGILYYIYQNVVGKNIFEKYDCVKK